MQKIPVSDRARGRWPHILKQLGVPADALTGQAGPCFMCGGVDRAYFSNYKQLGCYHCRHCFKGDGFALLMQFHGWSFAEAAAQIETLLDGGLDRLPVRYRPHHHERTIDRLAAQQIKAARLLEKGQAPAVIANCFRKRGLEGGAVRGLRGIMEWMHSDGKTYPAVLGGIRDSKGIVTAIQALYLNPQWDIFDKKFVKGMATPRGGYIRLAEPVDGVLGVAEGVITAMSASKLFGLPTWSLVTAAEMARWQPPAEITKVFIFGDNDSHGKGQDAANRLASHLVSSGLKVEVHIPERVGDWNDVLMEGQ